MEKVGFQHKAKTGRFQTQDRDGREVLVTADDVYETDDPAVIAELDATDAVKRVKSSSEEEKD
jgi:hypothetical protein